MSMPNGTEFNGTVDFNRTSWGNRTRKGGNYMKYLKNTTFKNDLTLKVNDDFHFKVRMSEDNKFTEMRLKFLDYFDWALIEGLDKYTNMMDSCQNDCRIKDKSNMCCTTIVMEDKESNRSFKQFQCMDQAVTDLSAGIWLENFYYHYKCNADGSKRYYSGAKTLALGAASLLFAVSTI